MMLSESVELEAAHRPARQQRNAKEGRWGDRAGGVDCQSDMAKAADQRPRPPLSAERAQLLRLELEAPICL